MDASSHLSSATKMRTAAGTVIGVTDVAQIVVVAY
jgi:hypothetical protein